MSLKYRDIDYARQRLEQTVVTHKGVPVYVVELHKEYTVLLKLGANFRYAIEDYNDLDLTPVKLGFVNYKDDSFYCYRKPKRQDWRQGLRSNNFYCLQPINRNKLLISSSLHKTILGIYPSVKECMELSHNGEVLSVAFSRNFCLRKVKNEYQIYNSRRKKVATISVNKDGGFKHEMEKGREYLEEKLLEEVH